MTDYQVVPGPTHIHPFSDVLASDGLIFVTGIAAPGETAAEQTRATLEHLSKLLAQVDSSLDELVYFRAVVTDRSYIAEVNEVMREVLPEPKPACGILTIADLVEPSLKVEFEAIAHRGARKIVSAES